MEQVEFSKLLQDLPPGIYYNVKNVLKRTSVKLGDDEGFITLQKPDLYMFCDNEKCGGIRLFEHNVFPFHYGDVEIEGGNNTTNCYAYVEYLCQNCKEKIKSYFLLIDFIDDDETNANVIKIGEFPFYGPHLPTRLISLIGPDRELFLKGYKCEYLGLGIGAFSYYRRVIENQKDRLIDNIINVLHQIGTKPEDVEALQKGKTENQFAKAVRLIKNYIPEQLFIQNHNPLLLLHKALSRGVHSLTDEECLEYARSIRVILTEFADKFTMIMKDQSELKEAIRKVNMMTYK